MYKTVAKFPDFPSIERAVLAFWDEIGAFQKLRARNAGGPRWSFQDGPITANNPMGVHHAWGRTLKDVFQRYHAMNGRDERFQNGFDCQGLWVEVEVEKAIGLKSKRDIYGYGMDRFVRECKERVLTYAAKIVQQSVRLGYWCEWDDPVTLLKLRDALADGDRELTIQTPSGKTVTDRASRLIGRLGSAEFGGSYFTFSDENNYTIWAFLKKCHEQGYIYRGHDVMPWCGRCGTGLSQMEVAEGRRIVKHPSAFVRFPVRGQAGTFLLVWTTTPWTLTSNVAVAVNPNATYLKVKHGEWIYYVGKGNFEHERVQDLQAESQHQVAKLPSIRTILKGSGTVEVLGETPGSDLLGLTYDGPFDSLPAQRKPGGVFPFGETGGGKTAAESHRVIAWDAISETEGTGLVHIAPGCGAEDQALGVAENLPFIAPLDESSVFIEGFGPFTGRAAKDVAEDVLQQLRAEGLLVASEKYPHVYPHCWRCKEELEFRPVDEWFIRMDWRDRILRLVPEIRWIPPDGKAREEDWLRNMGDWMISKKRFWGLALPIWVCEKCGHFDVIGSREELKERAVAGWEAFDGHTPHRPHIDAVKIACGKCGGEASRVEDVGNPWLDAGIVPYSTLGYNTDRERWRKWFPADLVLECFPGQFRNWFYSMLAMSAMMADEPPFKTLLGHALVRDARGEEMHKSKGNAVNFDDAAEVLGAEVMRYLYVAQNPTQNLNFPDLNPAKAGVDAEVRRKLLTLWNCYSFFVIYANADGWEPGRGAEAPPANELDRWILSRLQRLVATARAAFEDLAAYRLIEEMERFDEDFSNWYLRRSRRRFWKAEADQDKDAAYRTLYRVLTTVVRVLAPVLPFLAEEMYQNLVRSVDAAAPESVHLTEYPVVDQSLVNERLENNIGTVIRIKNLALNVRMQAKAKIRQPLGTLYVKPRDASERAVLEHAEYRAQILEEINVKSLELIDDESTLVKRRVQADAKKIGPRAGKHLKAIQAALASVGQVADLPTFTLPFEGGQIELNKDDLVVGFEGPEHLKPLESEGTFLALDARLTPELIAEGIARDFNRRLQDQRKSMELAITDRIAIRYTAPPEIVAALAAHDDYLKTELLATRLEPVAALDDGDRFELAGKKVAVSIERATG